MTISDLMVKNVYNLLNTNYKNDNKRIIDTQMSKTQLNIISVCSRLIKTKQLNTRHINDSRLLTRKSYISLRFNNSMKQKNMSYNKRMKKHPKCLNCGKDTTGLRSDAKYCSNKCRNFSNHQTNYLVNLYKVTRARAIKRNIPFDIEIEDIIIPDICPVFNIPIKRGIGSMSNNSPSIDKIIPELGYVKGNVWVISMKANRVKSDLSKEELKLFAKTILNKIREIEQTIPFANV